MAAQASPPAQGGVYGYRVESRLSLRRLRHGPAPRGVIRIDTAREEPSADGGPEVEAFGMPGGGRFSVHRTATGLLVRCSATGAFAIHTAARRIEVAAHGTPESVEHRVLSTIVPMLLAQRDELVLHAAAVVAGGAAIVFCGPSGRGKSTLTLALARAGTPVLTEDGAAVSFGAQAPRVWPGALGVRLAGEGAAKVVLDIPTGVDAPVAVAAVVLLTPPRGDRVVLTRMAPGDGLRALTGHVIATGAESARRFALAARLARAVPVLRGRLPDDLAALPEAGPELLTRAAGFADVAARV